MKGKVILHMVLPLLLAVGMCILCAPTSSALARLTTDKKAAASRSTSTKNSSNISIGVIGGSAIMRTFEAGNSLTLRVVSKDGLESVLITDQDGNSTDAEKVKGKKAVLVKHNFSEKGTYSIDATDSKGNTKSYTVTVS